MEEKSVYKSLPELRKDLEDHLHILEKAIFDTENGHPYMIKVVFSSLRLLICDYRRENEGGLLSCLVERCGFTGEIKHIDEKYYSLQGYKDRPFEIINGKKSLSVCEAIRNIAQQDGLSHSSLKRSEEHFNMYAPLKIGETYKTNPIQGIFCLWGKEVFEFGNSFLRFCQEAKEKHDREKTG